MSYTGNGSIGGGGTYAGVTGSGVSGQMTLWSGPTTVTGDTGATYTGTGNTFDAKLGRSLQFGTVSSTTGTLKLANAGSAFLTTIQAGAAAAARTYTWPTNFGAAGTVLTDAAGNGTLSWVAGGGVSGSGAAGQVTLWSGASAVTGDAGLAYAGTGATFDLTVGGHVFAGNGAGLTPSIAFAAHPGSGLFWQSASFPLALAVEGVGAVMSLDNAGGATFIGGSVGVNGNVYPLSDEAGNLGGGFRWSKLFVCAISLAEGANRTMGTGTLNGATEVTISTTAVTANSRIFLTVQAPGGTPAGIAYVSSRIAGTSFGVKGIALDTSDFAWLLVEPN